MERNSKESVVYFPAAGLLIGCFAASIFTIAGFELPITIAAVLAVSAAVLLTGARDENSFARVFQSFAESAVDRGSLAGVVLPLCVILKVAALSALDAHTAPLALIVANSLSRYAPLVTIFLFPNPGNDSTEGEPPLSAVSTEAFLFAGIIPGVCMFLFFRSAILPLAAGTIVICLLCGKFLQGKTGRLSRDQLSAISLTVEIFSYLAIVSTLI